MEEIEVPTEHLQEEINEKAEGKKEEARERWTLYVALSTAFMAVLAAIAGLIAGHHSNEALIDIVRASDQWSYYQAKGIKSEVAGSTSQILAALKVDSKSSASDLARYSKEKEDIKTQAEKYEASSESHLNKHVTLAKSVTIFQIAIAISAIAIITRRKPLWYIGMAFTGVGLIFLIWGLLL
jgi:hypothetical protein